MKNRHSNALVVTAALLTLAVLAPAEPAPEPVDLEAPLADLAEGWNTITPGGSTTCSDGSPFRFFVRKADPTQIVFYLQGGGGCWSAGTCDPQGRPTYRRTAIEEMRSASSTEPEPGTAHGIAAANHPENPFADHSFVFVPYCTGDVHIGDRDVVYEIPATEDEPARQFTIHHRGYTNGRAALDWTYDHFLGPETVFVTGSSAGSAAAPVYTRHFAENYPDARVTALADSSGGYRNLPGKPGSRPHESWGALAALSHFENMSEVDDDSFSYQALYIHCLLYTSPSPRDGLLSRMPSSA